MIDKIVIKNFKCFEQLEISDINPMNIIVGNNNEGKSTILQAINLALTGMYEGKRLTFGIPPTIFNKKCTNDYLTKIKEDKHSILPKIEIELYLKENELFTEFLGNNNSLKIRQQGLKCIIRFDEKFQSEYEKMLDKVEDIQNIPVEYYKCELIDFANNGFSPQHIPIDVNLIDITSDYGYYTPDKQFIKIMKDKLDDNQKAQLNLSFRNMKENFGSQNNIKTLNEQINTLYGDLVNKNITLNVDISSKSSWETTLTTYFDETPFNSLGQGEQSIFKIKMALFENKDKYSLVLIEEPENHLSHSYLLSLIEYINKNCPNNQVFITTHSNFVLNKLEMNNVILLQNSKSLQMKDLTPDTSKYFTKLSGFNTLRLILSKRSFLVEGASDELLINKLYFQKYSKYPQEDEIDIICLNGIAFKRYLEIAKILNLNLVLFTDNDGKFEAKTESYKPYLYDNCKIIIHSDNNLKTMEDIIVNNNDLNILNEIFNTEYTLKEDLLKEMKSNKTEYAYKLFNSNQTIKYFEEVDDVL